MYWGKKMTIRQMNEHLHFGTKELGLYMKKQNISTRTSSESRLFRNPRRYDVQSVFNFYCDKGWSLMRIAKFYNVSAESVRLFMKENNILIRSLQVTALMGNDVYNINFSGKECIIGYVLSVCDAKSQILFCKYFTLFGRKQKKLNMIRRCIG